MAKIKCPARPVIGISAERNKYECISWTGKVLERGDSVVDHRGESGTFEMLTAPPVPGKSAKVMVDGREYYASVFSIEVRLK